MTGEVEDVLGPCAFTIDEPGRVDFAREVLVVVAPEAQAVVRPEDRITVSDTLHATAVIVPYQESGCFETARRDELADRPVVVARQVLTSDND